MIDCILTVDGETKILVYGPNLSVDPIYVMGSEPSTAPEIAGVFVVGSTPYLP